MKIEGTPREIRDFVKSEGTNLSKFFKRPSLPEWAEKNPYKTIIGAFCFGATVTFAIVEKSYVPYKLYDLKQQLASCQQKHSSATAKQKTESQYDLTARAAETATPIKTATASVLGE